jgi:hypothetical protein
MMKTHENPVVIVSNSLGSVMSRTNEGMTTWLESLAMNSLKPMPNDVSAGLHRLPGGSVLVTPSTRITTTTRIVDRMPRIEV